MARRASCASGDFTAAATWATIDPTLYLDSEANNTTLTTAYVASAAQTPGAITIDGIFVKVATRAASPTGTMSIRLAQGGSLVAGTEVTINVADLNPGSGAVTTCNNHGWIFFKFAAPVTLLGATAYTVDGKTSSANMVNLFRDATTNNWSHMVRTTTTGAPAAGDTLYVIGEHTGAGTGNDQVVDMDSTASTDYGPGTDGSPGLVVGKRGTLQYKSAASTNYYLKLSGNLVVYSGGAFIIPAMPRTSTAVLELDPVASGGMGIDCRGNGTVTLQGLSRSSGRNATWCLLNTDAAAAQTTLGVDTDTGWLNGDEVAIASTTRTGTESEARTLNADAGASSISVSAGLTKAHSGTSPTQAEVILLTRNVIVRSADSSKMIFCAFGLGSTSPDVNVDIDWVRFRYCGSITSRKAAIDISLTAGSSGVNVQNCSFDGGLGTLLAFNSIGNACTFANNVAWLAANTATTSQQLLDIGGSGVGDNYTITDNVMIGANTGGRVFIRSAAGTYSRNRVAALNGAGLSVTGAMADQRGQGQTWDGNVVHSCASANVWTALWAGTVSNLSIWRMNVAAGFQIGTTCNVVFDTVKVFGGLTSNMQISNLTNVVFKSLTLAGDTTFSTATGLILTTDQVGQVYIDNSTFGPTSGIFVPHTTTDINSASGVGVLSVAVVLRNTSLLSTVEVTNQASNPLPEGGVRSQRHDGTAGSHKGWFKYGTITTDATAGMYRTSSPSERLAPNNASGKLRSAVKRFAVASGGTATVSVYVRESIAGDGTDYNGNRCRLILKANPAAGIAADTVLATATVSSEGAFELLSGTTAAVTDDAVLEVYVDCDGTTGWVNVDDWSIA